MRHRPARVAIHLVLLLLLGVLSTSTSFSNCTDTVLPVFQCGFAGWFAPAPPGSGSVSAVWWQLGYGNNLVNIGQAGAHEGTGIAPDGVVFNGNDSGLGDVIMVDTRGVLPQYAADIPAGALCSNYHNSWAGPGTDGCADNPRDGAQDDDNLLNPYFGSVYGPGEGAPYETLSYQIDYPMAFLLRESTRRHFALAFVASKARRPPRGADVTENFYDLAEVANGDPNPVTGHASVIPWQPVPVPRVDSIVPDGDHDLVSLSWDNIRLVHDGSVRPSPRVVAGGVGVLDQMSQPGGLCRYQLQTAPTTRANPDPAALSWTNAGAVIPCPSGTGPITATITVAGSSAIRVRTMLGKQPRTASTLIGDARLGASGDLGFEATGCGSDQCLESPPLLIVGPAGDNQPPVVSAGEDRTVVLPASAALDGAASDDGPAGTLVTTWTAESGPGTVVFSNPLAPQSIATFSLGGEYVLRLTADDGDWTVSDTVTITVLTESQANEAPQVDAGPDQTIAVSEAALLTGIVTDDGRPSPPALTTLWTKHSGPGPVDFGDPGSPATYARFFTLGTYVLQLMANDGEKASIDTLTIVVTPTPGNMPPVVDAGPGSTITLPAAASLDGTVSDDGIPSPALRISWSHESGPGGATFGDPFAPDTTVQFTTHGTHVLRLTADDGELFATDLVTVVVNPAPVNQPPQVDAGLPQTVTLPALAVLDGTVADDGRPSGVLITQWSKASGPGDVVFGDPAAVDTTARFTTVGSYVLRLEAYDGSYNVSDTVAISVLSGATGFPFELRVARGSDDAEEKATGSVSINSTDLEMVFDADVQTIGVRFDHVPIAPGDVVVRAWLQFTADEIQSEDTVLNIQAQASDAAATFTTARNGITARPRTAAQVSWSPAPWTSRLVAGVNQRTPDLSLVIQEVVDRPGWNTGNPLVFLIDGSGHRTARAWDGGSTTAPLLHVELASAGVNSPPRVDAGIDQTIRFPAGAALDATVQDDGLPHPPGRVTVRWSQSAGSGLAVFVDPNAVDTTVNFTLPGVYGLRLEASDGELVSVDEITITVLDVVPELIKIDVPVTAGTDDAEEKPTGTVSLSSTDLELVYDGSLQTVGVRLSSVPVPPGARIHGAWLQFLTDEMNSEPTNLLVQGEASDNPAAFTTVRFSVSARPRTAAQAPWSPPPWETLGEAGVRQRTPDLSAIVQEIVDRPGWVEGQAMVFVITGTGHRTAKAFDGAAAKAPVLHIEYE